jgi:glutamine---fructose-6-phosphate transaminase (isomerizing)
MSLMLDEARSSYSAVAAQLSHDEEQYKKIGLSLRENPPRAAMTIARGSSDHASNYFAYLTMARLGCPVASLPMSLVTLHKSPIAAQGIFVLCVSQSGQSPDLIEPARYLRQGGARTVALVNNPDSPLAQACEWVLPMRVGPELSVAATKSYIAGLVGAARLVAHWQNDATLIAGIKQLPEQLRAAAEQDWSSAVSVLSNADKIMVVGRGLGLSIALEAALKLKETCGIQAEAFSGAEIKHGPMALIGKDYPLLIFAPRGPAQAGLVALAEEMRGRGARVLLAAPQNVKERNLTLIESAVEDLDPLLAIQSFYVMAESLSRARGFDPDKPPHLRKVTLTS